MEFSNTRRHHLGRKTQQGDCKMVNYGGQSTDDAMTDNISNITWVKGTNVFFSTRD